MQAIEATLEILLDFADRDGETLLVFTSDHETGGLALSSPAGRNLELRPIWSTAHHTGAPVPIFAIGPGAVAFDGIHTNWEIGRLLQRSLRQ
jgi:alkaline phosphatase